MITASYQSLVSILRISTSAEDLCSAVVGLARSSGAPGLNGSESAI